MDENKRLKLIEVGYAIRPGCATCMHSTISPDGWGVCARYTYRHEKHQEERRLSIHVTGSCKDGWEGPSGEGLAGVFGSFVEFFDLG